MAPRTSSTRVTTEAAARERLRRGTLESVARGLYDIPEIYDVLMGEVPSVAELAFYDQLITTYGEPVLELACGTGRLTIPLTHRGHEVTGLDLSAAMLERANAKGQAERLQIPWVNADMREFDLGRHFGFIFVPAQSFQHLLAREDVERTLDCVRRHLRPGGAFLIQIFVPSPAILARALAGSGPFTTREPSYLDADSGRHFHASIRVTYDPATQVSGAAYDYRSEDGEVAGSFDISMRQFFPEEVDALLHYNGFDIIAKFGDAEFTPFCDKPEYQNILCRPRGWSPGAGAKP